MKPLLILILLGSALAASDAGLAAGSLRCEYQTDPLAGCHQARQRGPRSSCLDARLHADSPRCRRAACDSRHWWPFVSPSVQGRANSRLGSRLHFLQRRLRQSLAADALHPTKDRAYIWNAWSDGQREYHTENMAGLTWKATLAAAATNATIKARTEFYLHRVPEEFYDLTNDRSERTNLISVPARQAEIAALRTELLVLLRRTGDPFAAAFAHRDQKELIPAVLEMPQ